MVSEVDNKFIRYLVHDSHAFDERYPAERYLPLGMEDHYSVGNLQKQRKQPFSNVLPSHLISAIVIQIF